MIFLNTILKLNGFGRNVFVNSLNLLAKDSEAELASDSSRFSQSTRSKEERELFTCSSLKSRTTMLSLLVEVS